MPTDQDILRSQVRTTGFSESRFDIGGVEYRITDIGGAHAERRKWSYVFKEDVQVVIFVVALSGYDSAPYNDPDSVSSLIPTHICTAQSAYTGLESNPGGSNIIQARAKLAGLLSEDGNFCASKQNSLVP